VADYSLEKHIGQGIDNIIDIFTGSRQEKAPLILLTSPNFMRTLQGDGQYRQALSLGPRRRFRTKFSALQRGSEIQEVAANSSSSTLLHIS